MKNRISNDSTYLIGGALLGAAAMYFMDPEAGDRRRRRVALAAEGAYGHARGAVGDHLHHVSARAKNLAHRVAGQVGSIHHHSAANTQALAEEARKIAAELTEQAMGHVHEKQAAAEGYGHHASEIAQHLWDGARGLGARLSHLGESVADQAHDVQDDLTGRASAWRQWLSRRAADAHSRAQSLLGQEERHGGVGATAVISTALGFCAVGAGAMYFMDPLRGRTRRERVWKQTSDLVCSTGHLMRVTGKDLAHRVGGAAGHRLVGGQTGIDSRQLIDDIRAQVGNWIANPSDVQFLADGDGSVTVTGSLARDEVENLLTKLHDIRAVSHVINRISVRDGSDGRKPENRSASAPA